MKRRFRFLAMLLCLQLVSCASWIQQWRDNPIMALQSNVGYIQTAASLARGAFTAWATATGTVPPETMARFESIMGHVQRGLVLAQDGFRIAASAGQSQPNLDRLLEDAHTALRDLREFLAHLPPFTGGAAGPQMQAALEALDNAQHVVP